MRAHGHAGWGHAPDLPHGRPSRPKDGRREHTSRQSSRTPTSTPVRPRRSPHAHLDTQRRPRWHVLATRATASPPADAALPRRSRSSKKVAVRRRPIPVPLLDRPNTTRTVPCSMFDLPFGRLPRWLAVSPGFPMMHTGKGKLQPTVQKQQSLPNTVSAQAMYHPQGCEIQPNI